MNRDEQGIEIDLMQIVRNLLGNLKYIIVVTVLLGVLGYLGSEMLITPIYQASAKMIVNTRKDENQNVTNDQINSAKNLVKTYAVIICSRDVLNQVITDLSLPETCGQLAKRISVSAVNDTQVMQITVQHPNRDTALAIASKFLEIAPNAIVEKVEAGSVKTVEQAYAGSAPVSPSSTRNAVFAAMLGFILSCVVIVVITLTDNTYKTDMDIQRDLNIPVLGVIPAADGCDKKAKYGSSKERGEHFG
ncbi:MAG: capsular biosynthesis protein [Ruminococcaceae bacterium]|nr:capsular biosynthesis protein [Oscillospiraceae bacterium]